MFFFFFFPPPLLLASFLELTRRDGGSPFDVANVHFLLLLEQYIPKNDKKKMYEALHAIDREHLRSAAPQLPEEASGGGGGDKSGNQRRRVEIKPAQRLI